MEQYTINDITETDGPVILPAEPYRGIKPFRYADRNIFAARDWEKEQLLNLISLYRGSLVYGQSGIGKSSLVNAGLAPELEKNDFQAEIIRISPNREGTFIVYKITKSDTVEKGNWLPSLFDQLSKDKPQISVSFADFKHIIFQHKYPKEEQEPSPEEEPIPVLIFDQFEEFITLFEENINKTTAEHELSLEEKKMFQLELIEFFKECYYDQELRIKFLFVFREDYLAKFSKLLKAIPDLRDHTLRIKAISKDDIYEIIKCPFCTQESRQLYKKAFSEEQMELLTIKLKEYFKEDNAGLTEIQIACQYLYEANPEEWVIEFAKQQDDTEIHEPIKNIIQKFYQKLLEKLPKEDKPLAIDILLLLVLNERTRNIYHSEAIVDDLKDDYSIRSIKRVLTSLDNETRVVRSEIRSGGIYYEINSESIIPYINTLKQEREKEVSNEKLKKKAKFVFYVLGLISLFIFGLIIFTLFSKSKIEYTKLFYSIIRNLDNPTLKYKIASDYYYKKSYASGLRPFIDSSNSKTPNLTAIINYPGTIKSVFFKDNDVIGVVGDNSIDYFDKKGLMTEQISIDNINQVIEASGKDKYIITKRKYSLNPYSSSVNEIRGLDGNIISYYNINYEIDQGYNPAFAISSDLQTFFVYDSIYQKGKKTFPFFQKNKPIQKKGLQEIQGSQVTSAVFTKDCRYLLACVGHEKLMKYDLQTKKVEELDLKLDTSKRRSIYINKISMSADSKWIIFGNGNDNDLHYINIESTQKKTIPINIETTQKNTKPNYERDDYIYYKDFQTEFIRDIVVASTGNNILVIADDNTSPAIWKLNGGKITTLEASKENIISGTWSEDGSQIVTWTSTGKIYIWKNKIFKEMYKNKELVIFSPLSYRAANVDFIDQYNLAKIYNDKESPNGLLAAILNYSASLPSINNKPDDAHYKEILDTSLKELSGFYRNIFQHKYYDLLTTLNKALLKKSYIKFYQDSLVLLSGNTYQAEPKMSIKFLNMEISLLKIDTSGVQEAINVATRLNILANNEKSTGNYINAVLFTNMGTDLLEMFLKKKVFQDNVNLKDQVARLYGNLSFYRIFLRDFDGSKIAAIQGLKYGRQYDWINTNLALAHLLNKDFDSAWQIYFLYKDSMYTNKIKYFKKAFLKDFDDLEDYGIISKSDTMIFNKVKRIKDMLLK